MTKTTFPYQPGVMLHDAIMGAFRARGTTLHTWCAEVGISLSTVRNNTYGLSAGPKGRALLARIIEGAGEDVVRMVYVARLKAHLAEIDKLKG